MKRAVAGIATRRKFKTNRDRSADLANETDAGLTGAAFELANAGYTAMSDPDKEKENETIGSDTTSLRQAAERLVAHPAIHCRRPLIRMSPGHRRLHSTLVRI